jgi:hypothetical protein
MALAFPETRSERVQFLRGVKDLREELKAKRLIDVEKGIEYRKRCAILVNHILGGEARIERIHKDIDPSTGHKENSLLNRLAPSDDSSGMGLDYLLSDGVSSRYISIRRSTDPDLYYKMPQGVSEKGFVEIILPQIHFLLFTPKLSKYALVNGGDFNWQRAESRGNECRLSAIFKDESPYKHVKVNPKRDLHWIKVNGDSSKKSFSFGEGFDIPNPPLKEALLGILRRGSE